MTAFPIVETDARIDATASAGQTVFAYDFPVLGAGQLIVWKVTTTNFVTLLTNVVHYTVAGVGLEEGGTITLLVPALAGERIVIVRLGPARRMTDFSPLQPMRSEDFNLELDRHTMLIQELRTRSDRTLRIHDTDAGSTDLTLPRPGLRAGKLLSFDDEGLPITVYDPEDFIGGGGGGGPPSTNLTATFAELANAAGADIPYSQEVATVLRYAADTPLAPAVYGVVDVPPSHGLSFQSADDRYWEIQEAEIHGWMAGIKADHVSGAPITTATNDRDALTRFADVIYKLKRPGKLPSGGIRLDSGPPIVFPFSEDQQGFVLAGVANMTSYIALNGEFTDFAIKVAIKGAGAGLGAVPSGFEDGEAIPPTSNNDRVTLRDFSIFGEGTDIDGNGVQQHGLAFVGSQRQLLMENINVNNCNGTGIYMGLRSLDEEHGELGSTGVAGGVNTGESNIHRVIVGRCGNVRTGSPAWVVNGSNTEYGGKGSRPNNILFTECECNASRGEGWVFQAEGDSGNSISLISCTAHGTGGTTAVPGTFTNIGDMTAGGGLAAAFDGYTKQAAADCTAKNNSLGAWVGRTLGTPSTIEHVSVRGSNNAGYATGVGDSVTINLRAKGAGPAPTSATDGTLLGSITFTDVLDGSALREIASNDTTTLWTHVFVQVVPPVGRNLRIAEMAMRRFTSTNTYAPPSSNSAVVVAGGFGDFVFTYCHFIQHTNLLDHPTRAAVEFRRGMDPPIDHSQGVNIGNMTGAAGLVGAFDGERISPAVECAGLDAVTSAYIGKTPASPIKVGNVIIRGSTDLGFTGNPGTSVTMTLRGKTGATPPASATDGTSIGTLTFSDTANESAGRKIISTDRTTTYNHVFVQIVVGNARNIRVAEVTIRSVSDIFPDRVSMLGQRIANCANGILIEGGGNYNLDFGRLTADTSYMLVRPNLTGPISINTSAGELGAGASFTSGIDASVRHLISRAGNTRVRIRNEDTNLSWHPQDDASYIRLTGTLTADRNFDLSSDNRVLQADRCHIARTGAGAFNWNVRSGVTTVATLGVNKWAELSYDQVNGWSAGKFGSLV